MEFQLLVIAVFLVAFLGMKAAALYTTPGTGLSFLYRSPVFAPISEKRSLKKNQASISRLKSRFLFIAVSNILALEFYQFLFSSFEFPLVLKAWIFAPFIYLFTNLLGISAQCLGLLTKEIPTDLHNAPYLSESISEFWANRWNIWVGDWLAIVSKKISNSRGIFRLFVAFALSGLFHELFISLPYYIHTGESYFGYMTLFFLFQFLFIGVDKRVLANSNFPAGARRAFFWFSILAPMPLFINRPVLAFFGF